MRPGVPESSQGPGRTGPSREPPIPLRRRLPGTAGRPRTAIPTRRRGGLLREPEEQRVERAAGPNVEPERDESVQLHLRPASRARQQPAPRLPRLPPPG